MELTAEYLGGSKFEVSARGHRLICDQPRDNGGEDVGMSPPEFLLASLASCAGYYAAEYLKTRSISSEHLTVHVTAEKARHPARLGSFQIELTAPDLDDQHKTGLLRAVQACLIHNTLLYPPRIEISVNVLGMAPVG